MKSIDFVTLMGLPGSPYTRKMLALLRYRRIPYAFIGPAEAEARGLPMPKVPMFPTFYREGLDGVLSAETDSSPILRDLEGRYPGRSVIPVDPAVALLDMLLEDFADEWLTKAMFHYRWAHAPDIARGTDILPLWFGPTRPDQVIAADGAAFARRQIERLHVVGSSDRTREVIEASYVRYLALMNAHLRDHPYLMGRRPGSSDFATFGQLTQLAGFDPTPMAITLEKAPRVFAWVTFVEDLTGLEPEEGHWFTADTMPHTIKDLLGEVGCTYAPIMLANAVAIEAAVDEVDTEIDGRRWIQRPFRYHAKCLDWLRGAHRTLDPGARASFDAMIAGTGCENLFLP